MKDRAALARPWPKMRQTYYAQKGENDYTNSVLQHGVKEPLTMFIVRVVYGDGTSETYLVSGDGNSRLVSMWLARTGGDIDEAAAACVATVIGPADRAGPMRRPTSVRRAEQGRAHDHESPPRSGRAGADGIDPARGAYPDLSGRRRGGRPG